MYICFEGPNSEVPKTDSKCFQKLIMAFFSPVVIKKLL